MDLSNRDLNSIWHPLAQMKDYESFPPLPITRAQGAYIELEDGRQLIDANASWWCKTLGHGHPNIQTAIKRQLHAFEHVILAHTTNHLIVDFAERLKQLFPHLSKVIFASDGSCAVEAAIKMSVHSRLINGEKQRNKFMALENAYHGETMGCLSVSDIDIYHSRYVSMLTQHYTLKGIPYVTSTQDPLWFDCSEHWPAIEAQLNAHADELTAIILEPILQAAAGMLIYSQDFLRRLQTWAQAHEVHIIADEIATTPLRTGLMTASEHAQLHADFVCVGKGITAGSLPLSALLVSEKMYDLFYDDYENGNNFLHSHTFSGNALAIAAAIACLQTLETHNIHKQVLGNENYLFEQMLAVKNATGRLHNLRHIGAVVAADLILYEHDLPLRARAGYQVYKNAVAYGALLRPIANTIYWCLPLTTQRRTIEQLRDITIKAIKKTFT